MRGRHAYANLCAGWHAPLCFLYAAVLQQQVPRCLFMNEVMTEFAATIVSLCIVKGFYLRDTLDGGQ
jgi:hypothetical protein